MANHRAALAACKVLMLNVVFDHRGADRVIPHPPRMDVDAPLANRRATIAAVGQNPRGGLSRATCPGLIEAGDTRSQYSIPKASLPGHVPGPH